MFITKMLFRHVIMMTVLLLVPKLLHGQTITSTMAGGNWNQAATWVGGVIPTENHNVIINGPVAATSATCLDLTINAGQTLQNVAGPVTLTVNNVVNNGTLRMEPGGWSFTLNVKGNITNNGGWLPSTTRLIGSGDQVLTQGQNASFEGGTFYNMDNTGLIRAGSALTFRASVNFKADNVRTVLDMQNYALTLDRGILNDVTLRNLAGLNFANGGVLGWADCSGAPNIHGLGQVNADVHFEDTITVTDTLQNVPGPLTLYVNNIVNNGVVRREPNNWSLTLEVKGNLTNNGFWNPSATKLTGTTDQILKQADGKGFAGDSFFNMDTLGVIKAASGLTFRARTNFLAQTKWTTLDMQSYALTLDGVTGVWKAGQINEITLRNLKDIYFANYGVLGWADCYGAPNIHGLGVVDAGVYFNDTMTVTDTLQNVAGPLTLYINHIINNGAVRREPGTWSLTLEVKGNLTNNGFWNPTSTKLTGLGDQLLQQTGGKAFAGDTFFNDDTLGVIKAGSALTFRARTNFKASNKWTTLDMQNYALTLDGLTGVWKAGQINEVTLRNLKDIYFANYGVLGWADCSGAPNIHGLGVVDAAVYFNDTVTVTDTLQNVAGPLTLYVNNIVNNGVLRRETNNWSLTLEVKGNLTNNAFWNPSATKLTGTADQILKQADGKAFAGDSFFNMDTLGVIKAASGLTFRARTNFLAQNQWTILDMQNYALTLDGITGVWKAGQINEIVLRNLGDMNFVNSGVLGWADCYGAPNIHGLAQVDAAVYFHNTLTVTDTLQNVPGPLTLYVYNIVNNGVVRHEPNGWSFTVDAGGSISGPGLWTPHATLLSGAGLRTINLATSAAGDVRATGNTVILTGDNVLPNLNISGDAKCQLAASATLRILSGALSGTLDNWGQVSFDRKIATTTQTYNYFNLSGQILLNSGLDTLSATTFGHQPPPTFAGAVKSWWRMSAKPANLTVTFASLNLYYGDDALGKNTEANLQVYHSSDGGGTWRQISTSQNTTRDANQNRVTITDAPASGDYVLSSSADVVSVRPSVIPAIIGRPQVRVGPPNRYTINYVNNSDAPTGVMAIMLTVSPGIHIERIEPSAPAGVTPQPLLPKDFALVWDENAASYPDSLALLFVESMAPHEERQFTMIVRADLGARTSPALGSLAYDPVRGNKVPGTWADKAPGTWVPQTAVSFQVDPASPQVFPVLLAYVGYAAAGLAVSFAADLVTNATEEVFAGTEKTTAREVFQKSWQKTKKDWFGFEKPAKEVLKDFAFNWGPGLVLGPNVVFLKIADFGITMIFAMGQGANRYVNGEVSTAQKGVQKVTSWDPNEKAGPSGAGEAGYITAINRMNYQIFFENKAQATAPAWKIVIVDTLRPEFDPASVVFGPTSHAGWTKTVTGQILRWEIEGIELPPNVHPPEGEGWVGYSVLPKSGLASGATLRNTATITFDLNAPITTNATLNTLDFAAPVTQMTALPATVPDTTVLVRWHSADDASGVQAVTIYQALDGGGFYPLWTTGGDSLRVKVNFGHTYAFYALAKDFAGNAETVRPNVVTTRVAPVSIEDDAPQPTAYTFGLSQNYPNPFNPATTIAFTLPQKGRATLKIYNVAGQVVATLLDDELSVGLHNVVWQAQDAASGVYFYRLQQGKLIEVRKMLLLK